MKTLVLANQKGGVGKSFVHCQFSYFLVQAGLRVLNLELDHQKNSSKSITMSGRAQIASFTASELLAGHAGAVPAGAFVLIPGDDELSTLERQPDRHNGFVNALKDFLVAMADRFDVCIIDTNPNPDIRYAAALITADYLLSPIELNQEAIDGIGSLLYHKRYGYRKIKQVMNGRLELLGILPNMVEATPFQRGNFAQLVATYSSLLISIPAAAGERFAYIPNRTAIAEAQAAGVPLWLLRQTVPEAQVGKISPDSMPIRTSARDAWREVKPAFEIIAKRMGLEFSA
jgi:chromosome partitioning protein